MLVAWNTSPKDRCQLSSLQDAQEYQLRSSYSLKYCGERWEARRCHVALFRRRRRIGISNTLETTSIIVLGGTSG